MAETVESSEHFSKDELKCKCCGVSKMNADFMEKIEELRVTINKPLKVNSAFRCPDHNQKVASSGPDGPHTTGAAMDIKASGNKAREILRIAIELKFKGIGIDQKGAGRFIHLDDCEKTDKRTRPATWSY